MEAWQQPIGRAAFDSKLFNIGIILLSIGKFDLIHSLST